ncbi:MAG: ABC transporter ATP-binding protein [Polyangiaceae bacterium]|nr:ABC transporter ATP-binding protein [Polyangiaceae bacterium]
MIRTTVLTVELGGRLILDRITIDVKKGEAVALVGSNGSGKTTLLRALLGLVPFTGHASVDGHDVLREPVAARTLVGYLPQKPAFGDVSALEALAFVAKLRRIDKSRVTEVLREVGLEKNARDRVRTFSGGMQQRLSLAVVLLTNTPVLLLDEPTASLDREGQRHFIEIVKLLRSQERTVLLASHRNEEIARLTDRVLHLEGGRLVDEALSGSLGNVIPFVPKAAMR